MVTVLVTLIDCCMETNFRCVLDGFRDPIVSWICLGGQTRLHRSWEASAHNTLLVACCLRLVLE